MNDVIRSSKYEALCSRLRQRLITVPRPGAQAFKPTYPKSFTYTTGTVHKPGDSAGYVSFNPTMGACAAGYDPSNVLMIEYIFVVDPLMEEAARALEDIGNEPPSNETLSPPKPETLDFTPCWTCPACGTNRIFHALRPAQKANEGRS